MTERLLPGGHVVTRAVSAIMPGAVQHVGFIPPDLWEEKRIMTYQR
ncbi:MAG: hypothetical protein KA314_07275 [Chloroflexi bacterium]|nr:hypothetical protein [Chloroflexota bacterium]MBP8055627.1 hypothetical protein [Chloroflexota bacterium]